MTGDSVSLHVEWMPTIYPGCDEFGGVTPIYNAFKTPSWETFPASVMSFGMQRGRQASTDDFRGGTAHVVFYDSDGSLDPVAGGSVTADTYGCPVRVVASRPGAADKVVFTGFVDSPWTPSWGRGRSRTVAVDLSDWFARSASDDMPGCAMNLSNGSWSGSPPHDEYVWWRGAMTATAAAPANNASVTDFARGGNDGVITSGLVTAVDPIAGCDLPSLQLAPATVVKSASSIAHTDYLTAACAMTLPDTSTYSAELVLFWAESSGGAKRWSIGVDTVGRIVWRVYNTAGTSIASNVSTFGYAGKTMVMAIAIDYVASVMRPYPSKSVSFTGAGVGSTYLCVGGAPGTYTDAVVTVGNVSYAGASSVIPGLSVVTAKDTVSVQLPKGTGTPFTPSTSQPAKVDSPPYVERPTDAVDITGDVAALTPLQGFMSSLAAGIGGVVWCRRDGWIVMRTADDLGYWPPSRGTNHAVDDGLYQVVARITDAPIPAPITGSSSGDTYTFPVLRYSGPGHDGPDPGRVANQVAIGNALIVDPASIRRYGVRPLAMTPTVSVAPGYVRPSTDATGLGRLSGQAPTYPIAVVPDDPICVQAQAIVDARKDPTIAIPSVQLEPYGDDAITTFVLDDLELEARVLITQSDQVTGAPILDDVAVRVQGETWDWADGGASWTVTLDLAIPTPNR